VHLTLVGGDTSPATSVLEPLFYDRNERDSGCVQDLQAAADDAEARAWSLAVEAALGASEGGGVEALSCGRALPVRNVGDQPFLRRARVTR